jgi:hypothetical protein
MAGLGAGITFLVMSIFLLKGAGGGGKGNGAFGGKGGTGAWLKRAAFALRLIAGGGFSIAFLSIGLALVTWGTENTAGWVGITAAIAFIGIGWWAMDGIVLCVLDLIDSVPDDEAFKAALFIPTTVPLGVGSLWEVFTNPQGFPTGFAALVLSGIGGYFMHRILGRIAGVSTGKKVWHWLTALLCLFVGVMHVPAFVYINEWMTSLLSGVRLNFWIIDTGLLSAFQWAAIGAACAMLAYGVGDNLKGDKLPGWPTWWAGMYSIPVFSALGMIAIAGFQTNAEAVFTAFS